MERPPFRVTAATLDVLEILLSGLGELYGLRIAKLIDRPSGSVVPILMRLERCGWVTSDWEPESRDRRGPRRRFYELDPDHAAAARELLADRRRASIDKAHRLRPGLAQRIDRPAPARGTI
ncbi:helix-turn-helix transcriptional regulator [Glycomyces albidus]|uniref:PadR family transcriptional regulator n=1 Tax=Glycomyces albidus TaxID=2656774 RepID=A0A6L5G986_9ACTN|nr:helix-turn-helix transcriptional regulator [Glycomyces albidus]MQM26143.1 PadR family transcriptional regulator [Glycomyces albidus]